MTEYIHVEPAHEHRPAFAAWGLRQFPPLQTASAQGWDVPLDLYADIPPELLAGGVVDGFPYGVPNPQPAPQAPEGGTEPASVPRKAAPSTPRRRPRRKKAETPTRYDTLGGLDVDTSRPTPGDTPGWGADA